MMRHGFNDISCIPSILFNPVILSKTDQPPPPVTIIPMPATLPPIDEIKDGFTFLDDWDDRFQYLIDLGKKVPKMDDADLTEANRVHGCQSNVWLKLNTTPPDNGTGPTVDVIANSDAHIVNGLIAVLLSLYDGLPVEQARTADAHAFVKELGLDEHLSPTRRNGLHAMIQRIQALADAA